MPDKHVELSLAATYWQLRAKNQEAEQSSPAQRALRRVTPFLLLAVALGRAENWIPTSVSLILLAACVVGLTVPLITSRRRGR
jgi:hypothetical protein